MLSTDGCRSYGLAKEENSALDYNPFLPECMGRLIGASRDRFQELGGCLIPGKAYRLVLFEVIRPGNRRWKLYDENDKDAAIGEVTKWIGST